MKKSKMKLCIAGAAALMLLLGGCQSTHRETGAEVSEAVEVTGTDTENEADNENKEASKKEGQMDISQGEVTFTDDLGREITVSNPERVAALIGSFTDIWMLAGGEVVAAANDSWESLELDLGEDVVNLGSILEPDIEQLLAAEPDLVLASANTEADLAMEDILNEAGITVAYFAVSDFDEYLHMLDICTRITGRRELYEENGLKVQQQIAQIKERVDGSAPTVLFLRASSTSVKAKGSKDNVCGEMLEDLGCVNIADSNDGLLDDLSMEAIIVADPDYIFVTTQGNNYEAAMQNVEEMLLSNPAWASLSAVQNGNYYLLEKRLYNLKPNAKWGEAYKKLADILYPDN